MSRSFVVNLLVLALALVALATVVGLIALWPRQRTIKPPGALTTAKTLHAHIVGIAAIDCPVPGQRDCRRVLVHLDSGADKGTTQAMTVLESPSTLPFSVGDKVRVSHNVLPAGAQIGGIAVSRYSLVDFERRAPLVWLTIIFAVLVIATGRWQGLRALVGLGASLVIVVEFVVPAILDGRSPTSVAFVGSMAIMLVTLSDSRTARASRRPRQRWAPRRPSC